MLLHLLPKFLAAEGYTQNSIGDRVEAFLKGELGADYPGNIADAAELWLDMKGHHGNIQDKYYTYLKRRRIRSNFNLNDVLHQIEQYYSKSNLLCELALFRALDIRTGTGLITFNRASSAYYTDVKDGVRKLAAVDAPRFEHGGFLVEGSGQNELIHSRDLTNVIWTKTRIRVDGGFKGPDNSNNAFRISATDNTNWSRIKQTVTPLVGASTFSVDLKAGNIRRVTIRIVGSNTQLLNLNLSDNWKRYEISCNDASEVQIFLHHNGAAGLCNRNDYIYVDFPQLENDAASSSPIVSGATPGTRSADIAYIDPANLPAAGNAYSIMFRFSLNSGDSAERILMKVAGETTREWLTNQAATEFTARMPNTISSMKDLVTRAPVGVSYRTDGTTGQLRLDHNAVVSATEGTVTGTPTAIYIGSDNGSRALYGHINSIKIFNVEKTLFDISVQ